MSSPVQGEILLQGALFLIPASHHFAQVVGWQTLDRGLRESGERAYVAIGEHEALVRKKCHQRSKEKKSLRLKFGPWASHYHDS